MHEYEISILNLLKSRKTADLDYIQKSLNIGRDSVLWALENLSQSSLIKIDRETRKIPKLTEEGKGYLEQFPEEGLVKSLYKAGGSTTMSSLQSLERSSGIGLIWAKTNGWIMVDKGNAKLTEKGKEVAQGKTEYKYRSILDELADADMENADKLIRDNDEIINSLKKRNLLEISEKGSIKTVQISEKGLAANIPIDEGIGSLTREIIINKKWEKEKFRRYDINANSEEISPARLHPMHEFIDIVRRAWFNMGFTEVSGPIIESAFWNFDVLFSPQDHPTRDMQDTFFLKNPQKISIEDIELMNRVKRMHVNNWKDAWKEDVAQQALLRTHTTSVSARYIKKFANAVETSYPVKLFSVGKVFRNESIDYKHLAELYQTDGIIIGTNLTFSNLISTLRQFYAQLGMEKLVVRPAYFSFVEPGLELFYYDEELQDTIELIGAGIIRKEITKAMGTSKTVLAWGAGLDRLMFKFLGIDSLTELYDNDVGWLRNRPEIKF